MPAYYNHGNLAPALFIYSIEVDNLTINVKNYYAPNASDHTTWFAAGDNILIYNINLGTEYDRVIDSYDGNQLVITVALPVINTVSDEWIITPPQLFKQVTDTDFLKYAYMTREDGKINRGSNETLGDRIS